MKYNIGTVVAVRRSLRREECIRSGHSEIECSKSIVAFEGTNVTATLTAGAMIFFAVLFGWYGARRDLALQKRLKDKRGGE